MKLSLEPYETKWRISAEEYQTSIITNIKGSTQASPILIAAQKLQDPMISDAEVASIIDSWLLGWSKKNIKEYSSYYSNQFISSKNQTLTEWIAYKKTLNLKYKYIEVTRKGLRIKRNKQLINATFMQYYKSDQFEGITKKTLVFGLENGEWKILKEII